MENHLRIFQEIAPDRRAAASHFDFYAMEPHRIYHKDVQTIREAKCNVTCPIIGAESNYQNEINTQMKGER